MSGLQQVAAWLLLLTLGAGCAVIPRNPNVLRGEASLYEIVKICEGAEYGVPGLDLEIHLRRPAGNIAESLWDETKDAKLVLRIKAEKNPLTLVVSYHEKMNEATKGKMLRTFYEITSHDFGGLRLRIESPDAEIDSMEALRTLRGSIGVTYNTLLERCVYGYET